MASRQCLVSVNRMVRAAGLKETGVDAATIEHARNLARMLDKTGAEAAPLNLLRLYDSALTKLQRAVDRVNAANRDRKPVESASSEGAQPTSPPVLELVKESSLDKVRRNKNRAAG